MGTIPICVYSTDKKQEAITECDRCGVDLCSSCGYSTDDGHKYCNECADYIAVFEA